MADGKMTLMDINDKVGMENVEVQSIHQSSPALQLVNKQEDMRVSFIAPPRDLMEVANGKHIGLVLWFDAKHLEY